MSRLPFNNNRDFLRYAGLTMQMFVSLGLAVFIGLKGDKWLKLSFPLLLWFLPLLVLAAILYRLIKETGHKKNDE
ncbi:MAG: ATPase F0F1 [Bacteroidota bacterium]